MYFRFKMGLSYPYGDIVTEFVLDDPDLFLSPVVTQHSHNQAIIICLCNLMRCYSDLSIIL